MVDFGDYSSSGEEGKRKRKRKRKRTRMGERKTIHYDRGNQIQMNKSGVKSSNWKSLHRRCCNQSNNWRDWSGIPKNVVFDIMDKLTVIDDYVRFGAVCRPWRADFIEDYSEINNTKHCSQPFLSVPTELTDTPPMETKVSLYSLSTSKVYKFHFRLTGNKVLRGSTFGWLVTMETKSADNHHVQLHNPFLPDDRIIHLPTLDTIVLRHGNLHDNLWGKYYLCKAVLSADPGSSPDFVVMAIMSELCGLAFFKSGDTDWTSIGDWAKEWEQQIMFHDVIFFRKTKQFYALRYNGQVLALHLETGGREPTLIQVVPPSPIPSIKSYLVEDLSSGQLLLVSKGLKDGFRPQTVIKIFELDPVGQHWIQMHDLGGKILFLGNNSPMLRPSSDCPGCQPDCVYYTNDIISRSYGAHGRMPEYYDGVYNLKDGTNQPHYSPPRSAKTLSSPIWLEPTLLASTMGSKSPLC